MFDIEDALDDGIDINELYWAVEDARIALKGQDSKGAKYLSRMLENITDEIEMQGILEGDE